MLKLITRKKRKFNYGGSAMGTTSGGGTVDTVVYTPSKLSSSMAINPIVTVPELQYRDPNELAEGGMGTTTPTGTQGRGGGNPPNSPGFKIDMDKIYPLPELAKEPFIFSDGFEELKENLCLYFENKLEIKKIESFLPFDSAKNIVNLIEDLI